MHVASRLTRPRNAIVDAERRLAGQLHLRGRLLDALSDPTESGAGSGESLLRRAIDFAAWSIRASELALAEAIAADVRTTPGGADASDEESGWLTTVGRDALSRLRRSVGDL